MLSYHVVSDVETEGPSLVVHEGGRVKGERGQANVEHPAGIGQQCKVLGRKWNLMVPFNVVELSLNKGGFVKIVRFVTDRMLTDLVYLQAQVNVGL